MPEYYAAFNKKTVQLSVREKGNFAEPFESSKDVITMGPYEAAGDWDAAAKARDHFIKEIQKCRSEKVKKKRK